MSTNTFNFDNYFKTLPNFSAQTQQVTRIMMDATSDIVKEQAAAAETALDFGMKAFRLPEATDASDFIADRVHQQRQLMEALSGSAERIFTIASDANTKALSVWMDSVESTTEEAAA